MRLLRIASHSLFFGTVGATVVFGIDAIARHLMHV